MASLSRSVEQLVEYLVPIASHHEQERERIQAYAARILASSLGRPRAANATSIHQETELARRRLVADKRTADALALSKHLNHLASRVNDWRHLPAALQLLNALHKAKGDASVPPVPSVLARRLPSATAAGATASAALTPRDATVRTPPAPVARPATPHEADVVRELLYVMQNIEGRHARWDDESDAFCLSGTREVASLPPGARQMARRLCELGWLYRQVASFVDEGGSVGSTSAASGDGASSAVPVRGLVPQSLAHALHEELSEWYRLLAVLEAQWRMGLSLLQLSVWAEQPLERMLTLVQLVRACAHLKGGAMTRAMARLERHGDPEVSATVRGLLSHACTPLLEMLKLWVETGELRDPCAEFFIVEKPTPLESIWEGRYLLCVEMIPCFMPRRLALVALLAGKTINFLRHACGGDAAALVGKGLFAASGGGRITPAPPPSSALVSSVRELDKSTNSALAGLGRSAGKLEYGQEDQLEEYVRVAADRASARLLELLLGKYQLRRHLETLKEYVLLGKGEFVQQLIETLTPHLSSAASMLHRHQTLALLETAVRACVPPEMGGGIGGAGARGPVEHVDFVLEHLDVSLLPHPSATGWDAFSLDYRAEMPVAAIINPAILLDYRRIFHLLWRLKRAEHLLSGVFTKQTAAARMLGSVDPLLHSSCCLRNELMHLVTNLQYYLKFEVVECSWDKFSTQLDEVTDLDGLIAAHSAFVSSVVSKALLEPSMSDIFEALKSIFETIERFAMTQDELSALVSRRHHAARRQMAQIEARSEMGRWGLSGAAAIDAALPPAERRRFEYEVAEHAEQYRLQLDRLFAKLASEPSLDLAFLSFRLDFNLYYEAQRDEDAAFRIAEEVAATDMAASHTPAAVRSAVGRA